ncbi:MAG: hypothetical protein QMC78_06255 [Methanocellales archaeon]|nr:hypothetical protein [Methanocellales archaeon]
MSEYKKRHAERKGIKKQEEVEKKLIEENLDDLKTSEKAVMQE